MPMPTVEPAILPAVLTPEALFLLPRKRWTRDECRQMADLGLLKNNRYELIEGEVVDKMGQGRLHVFVVTRLVTYLIAIFGGDHVQSQAPISLNETNQPEPDAAVLTGTVGDYLERDPEPGDVRLVVEVSDTTLRTDRTVKALLYARAGIAELWIVNVADRRVEVFRQPGPNGYADTENVPDTGVLFPLAAPTAVIAVADLLP